MKIASLLLPATVALSLCAAARAASPCAPSDPRIAINAVNTPGTPQATYVITDPGSYYLDQDLVGEVDKDGIQVLASNVRIDLMGFSIRDSVVNAAQVSAVTESGTRSNIVISNGSISNWAGAGITFFLSNNVQVRDVTLRSITSFGILLAQDAVVERCNLSEIGITAIAVSSRSIVAHCKVQGAHGAGIIAGGGSSVRDCLVSGGASTGISVVRSSVLGCTVTGNLAGIRGTEALVADCLVSDNKTFGVEISKGTARNCEIFSNGSHGLTFRNTGGRAIGNSIASNGGDGIWAEAGVRIEDNDVRFHAHGAGIRAFGTGSFVVKNTLFTNSLHLSVPSSGNFVGPLVSVNAVNGRDEPWANIYGN